MNSHIDQRLKGLQSILNGVHQSSVGMSSATIGQERASFIDQFLKEVLPPIYRFGTGDATDSSGSKSGQLDVVIEYPVAPSLPVVGAGQSRLYLAEAIAAVIEVKSNLSSQWEEAEKTAAALAPLRRELRIDLQLGSRPPEKIPLFAVGYTGWKTLETLRQKVDQSSNIYGALVIENGLYYSKRSPWGTGAWALWALICDLHGITNSLKSASPDPFQYAL